MLQRLTDNFEHEIYSSEIVVLGKPNKHHTEDNFSYVSNAFLKWELS